MFKLLSEVHCPKTCKTHIIQTKPPRETTRIRRPPPALAKGKTSLPPSGSPRMSQFIWRTPKKYGYGSKMPGTPKKPRANLPRPPSHMWHMQNHSRVRFVWFKSCQLRSPTKPHPPSKAVSLLAQTNEPSESLSEPTTMVATKGPHR